MAPAGNTASILLVEDSISLAELYAEELRQADLPVSHVELGKDALAFIRKSVPDVVLLDLGLPDMDGLDILRLIDDEKIPTTVIIITAQGSLNVAVEAMRLGAYDFLVKPFTGERLAVTVNNALERSELKRTVEVFKEDFARNSFHGFVGESLEMQAVYRVIESAAASKATVFITGESGTGKEVCAQAIHRSSPRAKGPFTAINCAAIPNELIESEIFGHVKGAFTGATADRDGAVSLADGGTLFLDEICEMDIGLQAKLLRFIQTGTFQKVGSGKEEKVDIRLVCATNRDPWQEVEAGRFREDLYFRLHVIPMHLPRLADRGDDVLLIAEHFLRTIAEEEGKAFQRIAPDAAAVISSYDWPGNVRELENIMRNAVVLQDGEELSADMLAMPAAGGASRRRSMPEPAAPSGGVTSLDASVRPLAVVERETIEHAIEAAGGNIPRAAAMLEVSPSTIYRKKTHWDQE